MKAVGFDLDGTLIDSTEAIVASFLYAYRSLGYLPPHRDAIIATIRVPLEESLEQLNAPDIQRIAEVYRNHYVRHAPATTSVLPGVRQALQEVQNAGLAMGIATSKRRSSAQVLLDHLDLSHYFACCIGPEDVQRAKPNPEPILALIDRLEMIPAHFVYVGDTVLDVAAARAANVPCVAVTTGYDSRHQLETAGAAAIFDNIAHAVKYVLNADGYLG